MSLAQVYSRQYAWRRWSTVYGDLGDLSATQVLDLGCGIGDQVRDLSRLGATVVGIDVNQQFIDHAESRGIYRARFLCDDIANLRDHRLESDGVWTSFTAAYFPRFDAFHSSIDGALKPGGWLAITEVDDLFGHAPLASRWRRLVERYYAESLEQAVYRFRSRDSVIKALSSSDWSIEVERTLEDEEFCFTGPASSDVLKAWRTRLDFMMPRFLDRFGDEARGFDLAFLECLASERHRSLSRVWFVLARSTGQ